MTVWTSAADLARTFHVPIGTIHRWANEDDWPRIGTGKRVKYHHGEVERTYADRQERKRDTASP